ncbi:MULTISPECIES: hypothetical protein [Chryseobacterium]|jgi:hypothetical protein|uniref:Uncharacterized protein n=1 Tax=Chryseobacterium piscium TaxID=333702 RepID=A0A3D9BQB7_9FLAO|nr:MULTISPECIES: hypothetical protein [Chryseobacterium]REC55657.1 hypothetical protein DRF62_05605 [Chryseobacterium piscium]
MSEFNQNSPQKSNEDLHIGLKVLSFCIPLAGAIIYFVKKENEPVAAKSACNLALIGLAVNVVLTIVRLTVMGN